MKGLRHIHAPLSILWREARYRWLPKLVFAGVLAAMGYIWYGFLASNRLPDSNPCSKAPAPSLCVVPPKPVLSADTQMLGPTSSNETERVPPQ